MKHTMHGRETVVMGCRKGSGAKVRKVQTKHYSDCVRGMFFAKRNGASDHVLASLDCDAEDARAALGKMEMADA